MKHLFIILFAALSLASGAQTTFTGTFGSGIGGSVPTVQTFAQFQTQTVTHASTVIFPVNTGNWYTSQAYDPCIPDATADPLVLLFSGMGAPTANGPQRIGRATASRAAFVANPLTAWVEDGSNPTLVPTIGADSSYVRQGSCLYNPDDGGKLYEYYTCNSGVDQICLATSTDQGHTWAKLGVVMNPTIDGCSDETWTGQTSVLRRGVGDWIMVYTWRSGGLTLPGTRYVTSTDGRTWHGHGTCSNSLTTSPLYIEQHQIFMFGGTCVMLYETGNNSVTWTIGMASAPTCEGPFTVSPNSPILSPGVSGWDSTFVATPYFFTVNGVGYLWYCGTNESTANYNVDHYPMSLGALSGTFSGAPTGPLFTLQ